MIRCVDTCLCIAAQLTHSVGGDVVLSLSGHHERELWCTPQFNEMLTSEPDNEGALPALQL